MDGLRTLCEQGLWIKNNPSMPSISEILYEDIKKQRDTIRDAYKSETERLNYYFNFCNFVYSHFYLEEVSPNKIKVLYFDSIGTFSAEKLYHNKIPYIYLMFTCYIKSNDLTLEVTVLLNSEIKKLLVKQENRAITDGITFMYKDDNRVHFQSIKNSAKSVIMCMKSIMT